MTVRVFVFSQARFDSSRLPGKVLMDLGEDTLLGLHIKRVAQAKLVTEHIIVTSEQLDDDVIVNHVKSLNVRVCRGSKLNVLQRFATAAKSLELSESDLIVRLTADCPLVDPVLIDLLIKEHIKAGADYSHIDIDTVPRGFDAEIFSVENLYKANEAATLEYEFEHVTPYFYQHPDLFKCTSVKIEPILNPELRLCIDEPADFELVSKVVKHFGQNIEYTPAEQITEFLMKHPDLVVLNHHVMQKKLGE